MGVSFQNAKLLRFLVVSKILNILSIPSKKGKEKHNAPETVEIDRKQSGQIISGL
jgi:hypothetical protein